MERFGCRSLRFYESGMCMFTPEAHNYYLPVLMIASIREPVTADVILGHLIFHYSEHQKEFWWKRISILTPQQCDAVSECVVEIAGELCHEEGHVKFALKGLKRAKDLVNKPR